MNMQSINRQSNFKVNKRSLEEYKENSTAFGVSSYVNNESGDAMKESILELKDKLKNRKIKAIRIRQNNQEDKNHDSTGNYKASNADKRNFPPKDRNEVMRKTMKNKMEKLL
jgi:hypothetical protein